ncbi:TetR/AcrR family transcriptional regulator [Myceligenerans sp. I2]|uniref:TetR/AcrR family transcriptional regulator n=2 Tax=Myceligenerans indicum TaxID=2593663 RepID=A0ABS1LRD4_9MICO|nr:TetR/AcrR family transcriptional regulator [Myceligenerans indicum]
MSPEARRAAIVDAAMGLVAEHGSDVSTRELAEAAGVAEGTLFRAFGDKTTLLCAVAMEGMFRASNPRGTRDELAAVDRSLPLEQRIERTIEVGRARMSEAVHWMRLLRRLTPDHERLREASREQHETMHEMRSTLMAQREMQRAMTIEGLRSILAPDADRLRFPVDVVVALLEAAIAGTHARGDHLSDPPPASVVADALVHGIVGEKRSPDPEVPDNHDMPPAEHVGAEAASHHSEEL